MERCRREIRKDLREIKEGVLLYRLPSSIRAYVISGFSRRSRVGTYVKQLDSLCAVSHAFRRQRVWVVGQSNMSFFNVCGGEWVKMEGICWRSKTVETRAEFVQSTTFA